MRKHSPRLVATKARLPAGWASPVPRCARSSSNMGSCLGRSRVRQCETEDGSRAGGRFDPNPAAVALHYAFTDGQADARSRVSFSPVQPLEDDKDAFVKFWIDADAIVAHGKNPVRRREFCRNGDFRPAWAAELEGVGEKVLKQLGELAFIAVHGRERTSVHNGLGFLDG